MQLVVSDAHEGLKGAIAAVLPGATWQRCRTHATRIDRPSRPEPNSGSSTGFLLEALEVASEGVGDAS